MPGRKYRRAGSDYRYSINGQEKESELSDNITTALFWEYDSRIVRRWNIDPVKKEYESPYASFSNNPIWFSDPNGDEANPVSGNKKEIRRLKKYERKHEKMEAKMPGASEADIDAAMQAKYGNAKWMWVLAKSKDNESEVAGRDGNHAFYYNVGEIYRNNNPYSTPQTQTQPQTIPLTDLQEQVIAGTGDPVSLAHDFRITSSGTVSFTTGATVGMTLNFSVVQSNAKINTKPQLDAALPLGSAATSPPRTSVTLPPVNVDISNGGVVSLITTPNYGAARDNGNGTFTAGTSNVVATITVTRQMPVVTVMEAYHIRGQMGGSNNPNSLSPSGNKAPFKLSQQTRNTLRDMKKRGVHTM